MLIKRIGRASIITAIFTIASLILALLVQSLIVKIYGAVGLGLYSVFLMFINIYSLLSIFGLPAALSKYVAEYEEMGKIQEARISFNSILIFSLLSSILIGIVSRYITFSLAKILHIEATADLLWFISFSILFFNFSRLTQAFNQGLLKSFNSSIIQIAPFVGMILLICFGYFYGSMPVYYLIAGGYILSAIVGLFSSVKIEKKEPIFLWSSLVKVIVFAIPIAITSQLFFVSQWLDRFVLGLYIGVAEVGIYTASLTIILGMLQIPTSLNLVLLPSFSKVNIYGKEKLEKAFNLNIKFFAIFLYLGGILVFLFAEQIIYFLFSSRFEEFRQAITVLKILSVNLFLSAITIPASSLITGGGRPQLTAIISVIGVVFQLFFAVLLTKLFGIIGTAIGGDVTLFIITTLYIYVLIRVFKIKFDWANVFVPLLSCGCSTLVFLISNLILKNIFVSGSFLCLIYFILTWFFVLRFEEKKIIKDILLLSQ